jgi:hypothetical protein
MTSFMLQREISGFSLNTSLILDGGSFMAEPGAGSLLTSFACASSEAGTARIAVRASAGMSHRLLFR